MPTTNDDVLEIVKLKGPILPTQIVKELGGTNVTNSFFIGAMLSELSVSKKIKISSVKIGSSPLYYAPGQEAKLQDYSKYLHPKEQAVYERLKQEKILREKNLTPVQQVALRHMKDFSRALEVVLKEKEIFWKWYLLPNSEAEIIIKEILKKETISSSNFQNSQQQNSNNFSQKEELQKNSKNIKQEIHSELNSQSDIKEKNKSIKKEIDLEQIKKQMELRKREHIPKIQKETFESKSESEFKTKKQEEEFEQDFKDDEDDIKEHQTNLNQKSIEDEFLQRLNEFFDDNKINIIEKKIIKKNSEIELILKVPSAIGRLNYFCVAKNKKKCNDSDLSLAYVKAQQKNLPALFLSPAEMSKKGLEALDNELKSVAFKRLK